jgi:hypothetical protein
VDVTQSRAAYDELLATLTEVADRFAGDEWAVSAPDDVAETLRAILQLLATGLETQLDDDPAHPVFRELVTPWRKMLGDNPDARYHDAAVHPAGTYRVRGNTGGAVYVSFTVEEGARDGSMPTRTAGVLNDTGFDVAADGSFELVVGGPRRDRGWLPLTPDASRITVRHYWEQDDPPATPPAPSLELSIELLDGDVPAAPVAPTDETVAAAIRRMATFVRSRTLEAIAPPGQGDPPAFVSRIPNEFPPPVPPGDHALAAADASYAMAPYFLGPDDALVMRVRWPSCRYAGVALWNRQLQTFDYLRGRVGLNRAQAVTDADGTATVVIAHRDPGVHNWLTTEGRALGLVFWRFLLVEGPIEPITAEVVPVASFGG